MSCNDLRMPILAAAILMCAETPSVKSYASSDPLGKDRKGPNDER